MVRRKARPPKIVQGHLAAAFHSSEQPFRFVDLLFEHDPIDPLIRRDRPPGPNEDLGDSKRPVPRQTVRHTIGDQGAFKPDVEGFGGCDRSTGLRFAHISMFGSSSNMTGIRSASSVSLRS